jgi:DNA-binding protein HU-beta
MCIPKCAFTNKNKAIINYYLEEISVNKSELIELVASKADISKSSAGDALDAVLTGITDALKSGDSVTFVGFGTFSVSDRAARDGRNPRTGETIKIKASKLAKFKAGKALKDALN